MNEIAAHARDFTLRVHSSQKKKANLRTWKEYFEKLEKRHTEEPERSVFVKEKSNLSALPINR